MAVLNRKYILKLWWAWSRRQTACLFRSYKIKCFSGKVCLLVLNFQPPGGGPGLRRSAHLPWGCPRQGEPPPGPGPIPFGVGRLRVQLSPWLLRHGGGGRGGGNIRPSVRGLLRGGSGVRHGKEGQEEEEQGDEEKKRFFAKSESFVSNMFPHFSIWMHKNILSVKKLFIPYILMTNFFLFWLLLFIVSQRNEIVWKTIFGSEYKIYHCVFSPKKLTTLTFAWVREKGENVNIPTNDSTCKFPTNRAYTFNFPTP